MLEWINPANEPVNRSSYLTGFCQLLRSQWKYDVNDVKREPLYETGGRETVGKWNGGNEAEAREEAGRS